MAQHMPAALVSIIYMKHLLRQKLPQIRCPCLDGCWTTCNDHERPWHSFYSQVGEKPNYLCLQDATNMYQLSQQLEKRQQTSKFHNVLPMPCTTCAMGSRQVRHNMQVFPACLHHEVANVKHSFKLNERIFLTLLSATISSERMPLLEVL